MPVFLGDKMTETETKKLYLVDYDIPVEIRYKFYRYLQREIILYITNDNPELYRKALDYAKSVKELRKIPFTKLLELFAIAKSTQSVILTPDFELAKRVLNVARKFGNANIYEVRPLDEI